MIPLQEAPNVTVTLAPRSHRRCLLPSWMPMTECLLNCCMAVEAREEVLMGIEWSRFTLARVRRT